jgi:probable FeS assembly SUF system protein SufT
MERRLVVVKRDCQARLVPIGTPVTIPKNTFVTLTQSLGGNYTVVFNGKMARIDGIDADALGFEISVPSYPPRPDGTVDADQVHAALRTVYDPEIPVNIVDLGLVYGCEVDPSTRHVQVTMTLTSVGCGMGPVLVEEIKTRLARVPNVASVDVELTFDPPWSRDMMTEEAQLELGLF